MYNRRGSGHEECTTGGVQDMTNAQQGGCRARGMHDRRDAGHDECMTGGMQEMRNARQEGCRT